MIESEIVWNQEVYKDNIEGWERKRSKCCFSYIHLDLFYIHPSTCKLQAIIIGHLDDAVKQHFLPFWLKCSIFYFHFKSHFDPGLWPINLGHKRGFQACLCWQSLITFSSKFDWHLLTISKDNIINIIHTKITRNQNKFFDINTAAGYYLKGLLSA